MTVLAEQLDVTNPVYYFFETGNPTRIDRVAQQFTLSEGATIEEVFFEVGITGSFSFTVSVCADGSVPGAALHSTTSMATTITGLSWSVDAGTYWLVIQITSGATTIRTSSGVFYSHAKYTYYGGGAWGELPSSLYFQILGSITAEKATNPTPSDGAYGVSLNLPYLVWEHPSDSVTFDVYFKQASGEEYGFFEKVADGISDKFIYLPDVIDYKNVFPSSGKIAPLDYGEQHGAGEGYYWRVDVRYSEENIVQGDIWSFSTLALQPPLPDGMEYDKDTKELVESTSGLTGRNAMTTLRRLVAFAKNSVFYET